jgi:MlaD protein
MHKPLTWRNLSLGLATVAVAAAGAAAILAFGRVGTLHGRTLRLFVAANEAQGVIRGTEVWFDGEKIGTVRGTRLRPYTVDTARRVLVELDVLDKDAVRIRKDSRAQIRPGTSQLGPPVVFFSGGTANAAAVRDRDTIVSDPQSPLDVTRAKFADLEQQIPEIRADIDTLSATFFSPKGTLGQATRQSDAEAGREFRVLSHRLNQRRAKAAGSLALVSHGTLMNLAHHALTTTDSLVAFASGQEGILARARHDTAFRRTVANTRAELSTVRTLLNTPTGTSGRMKADSAIRRQLDDADSTLRHLELDAAKHPDRYSPW